MNSSQQKALTIADQGYLVRATGKPTTAPAALRNTPKADFEVSRNEIRL